MPMIIVGNGIGAGIGYYALNNNSPEVRAQPILIWFALMLTPMLWSYLKLRTRPRPSRVSARRINYLTAYSGALGISWGVAELVYLPHAPFVLGRSVMKKLRTVETAAEPEGPCVRRRGEHWDACN